MKAFFGLSLILLTLLYSCKSKPSESEIKRCIAEKHFCEESVKINSLEIINSSEREFLGIKGYEFIVNYEVEWTSPCQTIMGIIPSGNKSEFYNKKVFVRKMDKGWTCE